MSHHKIEYDCKCKPCKGTGLYIGIVERDGFAVVCHHCAGTGKRHEVLEYDDFEGKEKRDNVIRVLEINPGICAGVNPEKGFTMESYGGMPYEDWLKGEPFPLGSEMRLFACPAWWYQSADYGKKPRWDWCRGLGAFYNCDHFPTKEECWERFDREAQG
ncbi:hypothetical protein KKE60_04755 [Patescibacteria group bacterium]|nr:hypothetical protein [Patescibacteria group bacterium]